MEKQFLQATDLADPINWTRQLYQLDPRVSDKKYFQVEWLAFLKYLIT